MFTPESYTIIAHLFPRLLGLIYLAAFGAFIFQITGLIGSNGILPIARYLKLVRKHYPKNYFRIFPTIFWLNSSDAALMSVAVSGTILSLALVFGIFPTAILFLLYVLYLSIVSAGQEFLSFGWEGFLLEITFNAFFLSLTSPPNLMVWISINLLLFRFHFQAGAVKLQSRDPNWRNLTALAYHYQSQPIPNMWAWYVHKLPMWFHKLSTLFMFIVELIICFGVFGNEPIRLIVFVAFFGLQFTIWATGNFSYLNHLTTVFSTLLVANMYLPSWLEPPGITAPHIIVDNLCTGVGTALTIMQLMQLWQHFVPNPLFGQWLQFFAPYHVINPYGIFAVMTTTRHEIIFEGSNDGIHWEEYLFYHKPSEITRRPRRIAPYQPRIDWQAWFLPLGSYRYDTWFDNFIYHLLKGTPNVLALIRFNPFPTPPRYIRTMLYEYQFSSAQEKKDHGCWWRRTCYGLFTKPVSLDIPNS